jgi:hypothetical protein
VTTGVKNWTEDSIVQLHLHTTEVEQSMGQMEAEIRRDLKKMNAAELKANREKIEDIA